MNLTYGFSTQTFANILTIINILQCKNIYNVNIINCDKSFDIITVNKILAQNKMRTQFINIGDDFIRNSNKYDPKIGIVLNTACKSWKDTFDNIDVKYSFKYPFVWLIIINNVSATVNVLSQYPIQVDADVTITCKINDTKETFELYEIFNTGFYRNGTFQVQYKGPWNSTKNKTNNYLTRMDLSGVLIKVTVVVTRDLINETIEEYLVNSVKDGMDSIHKSKFFMILKYIQAMYNFTMELSSTHSWGYVRNGSFDGMVGALINGQADIGGSPIFFRIDRSKFIDYAVETWPASFSFVFRHPKHSSGFYTIYTRPLDHSVWYCIFGLLLITGVSMFLILKANIRNQSHDAEDSSISLAFLFSFGTLCQQGMPITRNTASVKVLIFITLAYSVTLYQYYNAVIVATLLREPPTTIKTLRDLLHSNLKIGVEDVLYNKDYFQRTTDPVAIELYKKKVAYSKHYNFFEPDKGMALVKQGGFAYHLDTIIAYRFMQKQFTDREICELRNVILYPPQKMAAAVPKRSPYKEHMASGIRKIFESGLMRRLKTSLDAPMPKCTHTPDSSIFSVNISEFSSPLIALTFGMIISLIILCCEIFIKNVTKN
ncbi:hypothetical protein K1T71_008658 [Dendrolimus kikuchii]|uniref:Uncharacterized protein n=1 Tax=Dendrolimus kikuchii TaxID=765133 RepID=A0ACC1CUY5_9NEOP|nr:hypothetical protein K1T71_008658 [Dendrolimus kikuchii]